MNGKAAMRVRTLYDRGIALTILMLAIATFSERKLNAAEITCFENTGGIVDEVSAERRAQILEHWPSGRMPNNETCRVALLRGPITTGDNTKFVELLRKSHPFLERVLLW